MSGVWFRHTYVWSLVHTYLCLGLVHYTDLCLESGSHRSMSGVWFTQTYVWNLPPGALAGGAVSAETPVREHDVRPLRV